MRTTERLHFHATTPRLLWPAQYRLQKLLLAFLCWSDRSYIKTCDAYKKHIQARLQKEQERDAQRTASRRCVVLLQMLERVYQHVCYFTTVPARMIDTGTPSKRKTHQDDMQYASTRRYEKLSIVVL